MLYQHLLLIKKIYTVTRTIYIVRYTVPSCHKNSHCIGFWHWNLSKSNFEFPMDTYGSSERWHCCTIIFCSTSSSLYLIVRFSHFQYKIFSVFSFFYIYLLVFNSSVYIYLPCKDVFCHLTDFFKSWSPKPGITHIRFRNRIRYCNCLLAAAIFFSMLFLTDSEIRFYSDLHIICRRFSV